MDAQLGGAAALVTAAVLIARAAHPRPQRAAGGRHYDRFVRGGHEDYVTGEEGPERLHLGDEGGWVEPLLPPVPAGGRVIRYEPEGSRRWRVSVTDSGKRTVADGRGRSPASAFTAAMESAGVRGLAQGGPLLPGGAPVQVRLVTDRDGRVRTRDLRFDGQPGAPRRRAGGGQLALDFDSSAAHAQVTISHTPDGGTVLLGDARPHTDLVKRAGFRWSGRERFWYQPHSRDRHADRARIDRLAGELRGAGLVVDVEIDDTRRSTATREEARSDRLAERQERLEDRADREEAQAHAQHERFDRIAGMIPMGQPVLVGHHSEKRHRRDLARMDTALQRSAEASRAAKEHQRRAEASRAGQAHRETLPATLRRIKRLEADERDIRRHLKGELEYSGGRMRLVPPSEAYREQLQGRLAEVTEDLAYWRAHAASLEEGGVKRWGPSDFAKGDTVVTSHGRYRVVRVNAKSLTVPSIIGGSWTDTIPYDKVTGKG